MVNEKKKARVVVLCRAPGLGSLDGPARVCTLRGTRRERGGGGERERQLVFVVVASGVTRTYVSAAQHARPARRGVEKKRCMFLALVNFVGEKKSRSPVFFHPIGICAQSPPPSLARRRDAPDGHLADREGGGASSDAGHCVCFGLWRFVSGG